MSTDRLWVYGQQQFSLIFEWFVAHDSASVFESNKIDAVHKHGQEIFERLYWSLQHQYELHYIVQTKVTCQAGSEILMNIEILPLKDSLCCQSWCWKILGKSYKGWHTKEKLWVNMSIIFNTINPINSFFFTRKRSWMCLWKSAPNHG